VNDILEPFMENPAVTVVGLVCLVLLFALMSGSQDEWMRIARKLALVIGGFLLLAIIFGLVLSRTIVD
jgi:hypothetical protein